MDKRFKKDLLVRWTIETNGEPTPLEGRDLKLEMKDPLNRKAELPFDTHDNVVEFHFAADLQKVQGAHYFTLWENFGKIGQTCVDSCEPINLVASTCMERDMYNGLDQDTVTLPKSNIEIGVAGGRGPKGEDGESAYDVAVRNGFVGNESEWLASLHGADGKPGKDGIDGKDGQPGRDGIDGQRGEQGIPGEKGEPGTNGINGADGQQGPKGDPFKYEDFTPEQLKLLKGPKGDQGDPGRQGEQGLPGEKGEPGAKGEPGTNGKDGLPGKDGKNGKDAVVDAELNELSQNAIANSAVTKKLRTLEEQLGETAGSVSSMPFKCESIGELEIDGNLLPYNAWSTTLNYDTSINKFVAVINSADSHGYSQIRHYVIFVNPDTLMVDNCKEITSPKMNCAICGFAILKGGKYIFVNHTGAKNSGEQNHVFTSTDRGDTWVDGGVAQGIEDSSRFHLWNLKQLSSGRIIAGMDVLYNAGVVYSDDFGMHWTHVIPTTAGGDYESEICVIEMEPGNLMAICRYSMPGNNFNNNADPAAISYSTDNGDSWTQWKRSESITNMNSSNCDGFTLDGTVHIFATSRWYAETNESKNTGRSGALTYYMANFESAKMDQFTAIGIVKFANGVNGENSGEFHAASCAIDNRKRLLVIHMDKGANNLCSTYALRGEIGGLSYLTDAACKSRTYSAYDISVKFENLTQRVALLQKALSKIPESGVTPPTDLKWQLTYEAETAGTFMCAEGQDMAPYYYYNSALEYLKTENEKYEKDEVGKYYSGGGNCCVSKQIDKRFCKVEFELSKIYGDYGCGSGFLHNGKLYFFRLYPNRVDIDQKNKILIEFDKDTEKMTVKLNGISNGGINVIKDGFLEREECCNAMKNFLSAHSLDAVPPVGTYLLINPSQGGLRWYTCKIGESD